MTFTVATYFLCSVFTIAGLLSVLASLLNWHWFFNSSNAKLITGRMSRRTARILYFVLGCLILAMDYALIRESLKAGLL